MKKLFLLTVFLGFAATGAAYLAKQEPKIDMVFEEGVHSIYTNSAQKGTAESVLIQVPFTSQAPHGNWDDPYQEACEEASLLMVQRYYANEELSPDIADQEILNMVIWQELQNLSEDITIQQLAIVAQEYFGLKTEVLPNLTKETIRERISAGQPVIVPAAGRKLGNPYFSGEGPWYHMLVIIGYTDNEFITNDPGTRRGKHYKYDQDVLVQAIHNWTGVKEDIENGERIGLVLSTAN